MRERLQSLWEQKRDTPLAAAVIVVAAVLLAWQLGRLIWLLWSGPVAVLPMPAQSPAMPALTGIEPARIAALFGESPAAAPAGAVVDTTLQLRLEGVMENSDSAMSRAFISERAAGKVQSYRPGDTVAGGATLDRVEADHVVLTRGGREEVLRFDKPGTPPAGAAATGPAAGAVQTRNALSNVAERLSNSPMTALRQMGLRRTSQGYVVSITAPKDMLQRYGLQPGDRIVSINGQSVGRDLEADQQIMSQLQQAGSARVEVQRGAQTITLEQRL